MKFIYFEDAFSILEILVSISILLFMTSAAIVNFREAEKRTELNLETNLLVSNIRKVQNMVINGNAYGSQPMPSGGYGISYSPNSYIIFADNNGNKVYDATEEILNIGTTRVTLSPSMDNLLFLPPNAFPCMNDDGCASCDCVVKDAGNGSGIFKITVSHNKTEDTNDIVVSQISGRVGVE